MTTGWNVLVYAVAGTDDELARVTQATTAMRDALKKGQCNIGIQLRTKSHTTREWISTPRKPKQALLHDTYADDPLSLTEFLDDAHREFPGRSTALILWAHSAALDYVHNYPEKSAASAPGSDAVFDRGGAVLGGCGTEASAGTSDRPALQLPHRRRSPRRRPEPYGCRWGPDPISGKYLTNVGMRAAIKRSTRRRVELLGLNACGMASLEVAYELSDVSDIQLACQLDALPWPYGAIIAALAANPAPTTEELARMFVASVRSAIEAGQRSDALSALRSGSAIQDLVTAVDGYARRNILVLDAQWIAVQEAIMKEVVRVDDPYQVDLVSLTNVLGKDDPKARAAAETVRARFVDLLVDHASARPDNHGLSLFCPKDTHVDIPDVYMGTEFRNNRWREFLLAFQIRLRRQPV